MTSADSRQVQQPRVAAFDWLRGLAVVVMVQTHAVILLRPELRSGPRFRVLDAIDGLVAPSFLFSAGFAMGLVLIRAASAGRLEARVRESGKRVLEVLLLASLINLIWYPLREPKWLLRLDILHCIGLSLAAVLGVTAALAKWPQVARVALGVVAVAVFAVAPLFEDVDGVARVFLSFRPGVLSATTGATFPLLPWAGYPFLGASFGVTVAGMRKERDLWGWWAGLVVLAAVAWWATPWLASLYGAHDFWRTNPADAGRRVTQVLAVVALLRVVELRLQTPSRFFTALAALGTASLPVYFFHEMLLFEVHLGVFGRVFRDRAGWALYVVLVVALLGATWLCVLLWRCLREALTSRAAAPLRSSA